MYGGHSPLHPLAMLGKYTWRPHEVEARPDGLAVPSLDGIGAAVPQPPRQAVALKAKLDLPTAVEDMRKGGVYLDEPGQVRRLA